jgi:hypothetical protein
MPQKSGASGLTVLRSVSVSRRYSTASSLKLMAKECAAGGYTCLGGFAFEAVKSNVVGFMVGAGEDDVDAAVGCEHRGPGLRAGVGEHPEALYEAGELPGGLTSWWVISRIPFQ